MLILKTFAKPLTKISFFIILISFSWNVQANLACHSLSPLIHHYLRHHFQVKNFSPEIEKRTIEQYIKIIDPSKTTLLASDVKIVEEQLKGFNTKMSKGDCSSLMRINGILTTRSQENEAFAKTFLGKNYKIDENTEILNADKRNFAKNPAEKNETLKKFMHFQVSNLMLTNASLEEAKKRIIHRYELATKRVQERKEANLYDLFLNAFASSLDPHSGYFSPDSFEDFQIQMRLSLEGIGATLSSQDGYTVIEELVPGGAAAREGTLRPKDRITAVAQGESKDFVDVIDMELKDVVKLIRGKKGTNVTLTVLRTRGSESQSFRVTITRDQIQLKDQEARISYETRQVGNQKLNLAVIDLPSFYGDDSQKRSCAEDIKKLLFQAQQKNVSGIVLNLNRNGGGLLEEAVRVAGLFINQGNIVAAKDHRQQIMVQQNNDKNIYYRGPLVIMVSRRSASASEILAGALQDYQRALVVGSERTFGKGTIQSVVPVSQNLGAIKVTTGMYFIPGGQSTQRNGIKSDIIFASNWDSDEIGESKLEHSLAPQAITPFLSSSANSQDLKSRWLPIDNRTIQHLAQRSKARVDASEDFKKIHAQLEEDRINREKGVIRLSEANKKSVENQEREDKSREELIAEEEAPLLREALSILTDLILHQNQPQLVVGKNNLETAPPVSQTVKKKPVAQSEATIDQSPKNSPAN